MAPKNWTLTDTDEAVWMDQFSLDAKAVGGQARGYSIRKTTLQGGSQQGVDVVQIDNGRLSFDVLPTRGMGIWKARLGNETFGWQSPVRGPVHPQYVPVFDPSGLGWLDGFDELLVRCGLESNGAPEFDDQQRLKYPLHGRIANRAAHQVRLCVDGDQGLIELTGVVDESRFHFAKLRLTSRIRTQVDQPYLEIEDTVQNLSGGSGETQMLYHVNFGAPLLDAGAQLVAPAKTIVPRNSHAATGIQSWNTYAAPQAGYEEQVYFMQLFADQQGQSRVLLKNAHSTRGALLQFDLETLPCFTVWKNTTSLADGYVTGIEPGTNFPNPRSFEGQHDRVVKLDAGASVTYRLRLQLLTTPAEVEQAEAETRALQKQPAQLVDQPTSDWCAE